MNEYYHIPGHTCWPPEATIKQHLFLAFVDSDWNLPKGQEPWFWFTIQMESLNQSLSLHFGPSIQFRLPLNKKLLNCLSVGIRMTNIYIDNYRTFTFLHFYCSFLWTI